MKSRASLHHLPSAAARSPPLALSQFCFFFQAEDGIRDGHVTGVQTCALPISAIASWLLPSSNSPSPTSTTTRGRLLPCARNPNRSEERRVGKECRSPGSSYQSKSMRG